MFKSILSIYILIGVFRVALLFLQPANNRPIAVVKRKWGALLSVVVLWFPSLLFRAKEYGIKTTWEIEVKTIKGVFSRMLR